jgi:hypothetical protein
MVDTTLGPCHYSEDMSEHATLLGVREDGPGWIPICENHTSDAESDGYTVQEVKDLPDAIETNEAEDGKDTDAEDTDAEHTDAEDTDAEDTDDSKNEDESEDD